MLLFVALVPEAPTNLQVATQSTTSIRVTWDSPQETNGPIVTYKVGFPLQSYLRQRGYALEPVRWLIVSLIRQQGYF